MNYKITFSYLFFISTFFSYAQTLDNVANDSLVKYPEYYALQLHKENIYIHTDKDIYEPDEDVWFKAYLLDANTLESTTETQLIFVEFMKLGQKRNTTITKDKFEVIDGAANGHFTLDKTIEEGKYALVIHSKNTLESTSNKILAIKEIQIVESIIPKILIDTEFSKQLYHRDEAIEAEVSVFSRDRVPYTKTAVTASLFAGTKKIGRIRVHTNDEGKAVIQFPKRKSATATSIQLHVKYKKQSAEHSIEIPYDRMSDIQFGMYPEGGNLIANLPNTVAFKALDPSGRPVEVQGSLFENGKEIQSFSSLHYGMGTFTFTPKNNKKYSVKLTQPRIDNTFELPKILPEGIKLQVEKSEQKFIQFSIARSKNIPAQEVYIRAQNRGLVYWMATASLAKERVLFNLPLEKFPQGIVEVTLFDTNFQPLAERLIYANLDQKLHVELVNTTKSVYKRKGKVTLKFKVKDELQRPVMANFSLSVHNHLFADKNNDYAMESHYYLFSELKGHVYDANYYFDTKNKDRAKKLDVLLLTQGWRNYVWNQENLLYTESTTTFDNFIEGNLFYKLANGVVKKMPDAAIEVSVPDFTYKLLVDEEATFTLPFSYYKRAKGADILLIAPEKKNAFTRVKDPFKTIESITEKNTYAFPKTDVALHMQKQSSYDTKFGFTKTNFLDEVQLTAKNTYLTRKDRIEDSPYIACGRCNVLNCPIHIYGTKPKYGLSYGFPTGGWVIFHRSPKVKEKKLDRRFTKLRGVRIEKVFYSPNYDKNKDEARFPDNRQTLFWAPNLVSNENGEMEVSFFTSDVQTTFLVTLEGTDGYGLLGGTIFKFDVD